MTRPLTEADPTLPQELTHTLNRVQVAMRADSWEAFSQCGLNPTQGQILMLLSRHTTGPGLSETAKEPAVSAPTVSDSVATLVRKGQVRKIRSKDDARAISVRLTAAGKRLVERLDAVEGTIQAVLSSLPAAGQVHRSSLLSVSGNVRRWRTSRPTSGTCRKAQKVHSRAKQTSPLSCRTLASLGDTPACDWFQADTEPLAAVCCNDRLWRAALMSATLFIGGRIRPRRSLPCSF